MLEVIESGVLYRNPHPDLRAVHACFPMCLQLSAEELICVYRHGSAFASVDGRIAKLRSRDAGRTWVDEGLAWDDPPAQAHYCYRGPGLTRLADGRLLMVASRWDRSDPDRTMYNPATEGYLPCDIVMFASEDQGRTWSPPWVVGLPPGLVANNSGPAIELPGGRLVLPVESWKAYDDPEPPPQRALALFSEDGGQSWGELTVVGDGVADGVYYWDQGMVGLGGGRLLVTAWTHDAATDKDVFVHRILSADGGRTWSPPEPTNLQGQVTFPVDLGEGRLLAVYNRRYGDRPGVMAALSADGGATWDLAGQVAVWDAVGQANVGVAAGARELQQHITIAFGKPVAIRLSDGDVLASFWCTQACVTHIRWCRLRVGG